MPEAYTVAEFCQAYRISRAHFYREANAGRLRLTKTGAKTLVLREDAERWRRSLQSPERRAA
jgi:excisionase family DNA binding protein